ncbi:MAG TPA: hypothetical protein VGF99_12440, partial [Myxococcota bacterium]
VDVVDDVDEDVTIAVAPLLPVVRAARIGAYPGAADDVVDVDAIVDVIARHRWLLARAADAPVVLSAADGSDDDSIRRHRATRLLIDALVLGLEAQKLRWGLRPDLSQLKRAFVDGDEARHVLGVVAALPDDLRVRALPPASFAKAPSIAADRQVHVVVGPLVRHLTSMFSSAVRRLRVDLALLGRQAGVVDDDDVYRGLALLDAREPRCRAERRLQDVDDGVVDDGRFVVVDPLKLREELVDRRLRSLLTPLKRARAVIVAVADDIDVDQALATTPTSVQIVVAGSARSRTPWLVSAGNGALLPANGDAADVEHGTSLSLPSPLLARPFADADDGAWSLLTGVLAARLVMPLPAPRVHVGDDVSAVCLDAVAAMVALPASS